MNIIEIENLFKSYRKSIFTPNRYYVLKGLNMTIKKGSSVALIGKNGAGKTTLFRILLGLIRFEKGICRLLGASPSSADHKSKIGYVPESIDAFGYLTVYSFLAMFARFSDLTYEYSPDNIDYWINKLSLYDYRNQKISKCSKGIKQRVKIANAFLGEPELILLDEPTEGLDPVSRRSVIQLLKDQQKKNTTIVISSHLLSEVVTLCNEIKIINNGRIEKELDIVENSELNQHYRIVLTTKYVVFPRIAKCIVVDDESVTVLQVAGKKALNSVLRDLEDKNIDVNRVEKEGYLIEEEIWKTLSESKDEHK